MFAKLGKNSICVSVVQWLPNCDVSHVPNERHSCVCLRVFPTVFPTVFLTQHSSMCSGMPLGNGPGSLWFFFYFGSLFYLLRIFCSPLHSSSHALPLHTFGLITVCPAMFKFPVPPFSPLRLIKLPKMACCFSYTEEKSMSLKMVFI